MELYYGKLFSDLIQTKEFPFGSGQGCQFQKNKNFINIEVFSLIFSNIFFNIKNGQTAIHLISGTTFQKMANGNPGSDSKNGKRQPW